jgi:hypothetical protein
MEANQFDLIAQELSHSGSSRRSVARALAGALLTGVAVRFGLVEETIAKSASKPKQRKRRPNHTHGTAQAAGKHSKKHTKQNKHHKKPKDENSSGDDFALCSLTCEANGGRCCPGGVCIDAGSCCDTSPACPDGSCPGPGECCPGEWMCPGNICHSVDECCPGTKPRGPTTCIPEDQRCDGETPCPNGGCVAPGQCCPGEKRCGSECIPKDVCCRDEPMPVCPSGKTIGCCHGKWICKELWDTPTCDPYGAWLIYNDETCACECPPGSVIQLAGAPFCCPADHAHWGPGAVCLHDVNNQSDFVCPLDCHVCESSGGGNGCCWSRH